MKLKLKLKSENSNHHKRYDQSFFISNKLIQNVYESIKVNDRLSILQIY